MNIQFPYILIVLIALLSTANNLNWYKNFGSAIDNPKCMENSQPVVEYYKINEYEYMFLSERVSWDEAKTICPIYDAQLATVDTILKANKLAAAIAQSNIVIEDIWIGGERSETGSWAWTDNNHIPTQPVNGFPPWVRIPDRPWKQCLAMDRFTVDAPLFVDLDCRLNKPFICQRAVDAPANPDVTLPSHMVTIKESTFLLYHAKVSWATAAAFCRMRGYRLAIIPNNKVAKTISTAMLRSRPSFENAWLSGHFSRKKWRWLSTAQPIQSYADENNYPPWHHNSTNHMQGCILLDRHLCDDPLFLVSSCDRRRDFICEQYNKKVKVTMDDEPVKINYKQWQLILVLKPLSWLDAAKQCRSIGAYLTIVNDYGMMKVITTAMSDQESEPVHVWLGGIYLNGTWVWEYNRKPIPTDRTGFLPWCDVENKGNNVCLNMDREAHDKPVVYGLRCKLKQPFVCTKFSAGDGSTDNVMKFGRLALSVTESVTITTPIRTVKSKTTTKLATATKPTTITELAPMADPILTTNKSTIVRNPTTTRSTIMKSTTQTKLKIKTISQTAKFEECSQQPIIITLPHEKVYINFFTPTGFNDTATLCIQAGGELAKVTNNELEGIVKELQKHTSYCAARHLWVQTSQACTYIRYDTGKALRNIECHSNKGYICEIYCKHELPKSILFANNIWSCSYEDNKKICEVSCKDGYILQGTSNLLCSTAGWVDAYNKTALLPVCKDENQVSADFVHWLRELNKKQYHILYVMDESQTIAGEHWWKQLQFIVSLIQAVPASQNFRMGLITFHGSAVADIEFNTTDLCKALEAVHSLRPDPNPEFRSYKQTLEEVDRQMKHLKPKEKAIIVLVTTGINHGSEYENILYKIPKNHKMFAIGISNESIENLELLASVMDEHLLLYAFSSFKSLEDVTQQIMRQRSKKLDCPVRLHSLPKETPCHQNPIAIQDHEITYTAFFSPTNYQDAETKCMNAGGRLAEVNNKDLTGIVDNIRNSLKECAADVLWIHDSLPCATIELNSKGHKAADVNVCTLLHGQLCEIASCSAHLNDSKSDMVWNCKKFENNNRCDIKCQGDLVLKGPGAVTCENDSWVTLHHQITLLPTCLDEKNTAKQIVAMITELVKDTDGLLFVVDKLQWKLLEIVVSLMHVYPVSHDYPLGVITFFEKTKVLIPYTATNKCKVSKKLEQVTLQKVLNNKTTFNYNEALKEAQQQISLYQHRRHTIIVFVTSRFNSGGMYASTVKKLNEEKHVLICMGIGEDTFVDLNLVASTYNDKLLLYRFNKYSSYSAAVENIKDEKPMLC